MLVDFAANDLRYQRGGHRELRRDGYLGHPLGDHAANLTYLLRRELQAVGTTTLRHVIHVILYTARAQMGEFNTWRVIAGVKSLLIRFKGSTEMLLQDHMRNAYKTTATTAVANERVLLRTYGQATIRLANTGCQLVGDLLGKRGVARDGCDAWIPMTTNPVVAPPAHTGVLGRPRAAVNLAFHEPSLAN